MESILEEDGVDDVGKSADDSDTDEEEDEQDERTAEDVEFLSIQDLPREGPISDWSLPPHHRYTLLKLLYKKQSHNFKGLNERGG